MANKKNEKEEPLMTEQEVWSIVEFARSLYGGVYGAGYMTPDLVSGRMKDITLNPMQLEQTELEAALKQPKTHESQLQGFSQYLEMNSMIYKRLISYLSNMLAFDVTYTSNAEGDDYKTPKYKKDLNTIENFLDKFEYKKEFHSVVRQMLRNDAFFGVWRDTGTNYVIQELPSEYCKITGRWSNGFLFSFNMYWFLQPGVFIEGYPDFFKKKYNEIFGKSNKQQNYNPSLSPELRGSSSWVYWVDIPADIGICFKLTPELATRLPYFTPLFNDLVLQGLMRNLQKNMNMAAASKIIMGEVPMLNKEIKATVKDSIAISPDLLGKFMALVKSAISDSIKIASAPLQNIDSISFETDNEMYDSYLRTALASSGVNSNLIFSSNIKPNSIETQLSLNVDEQMMTSLYDQFNDFLNYQAGKLTRTFKFRFVFEGTDFFLDRDKRFENAMSLFDKGIMLPQKIAASLGMKPAELRKQMEESASMEFVKKLTPPSFEQQKEMLDIQNQQSEKMMDKQNENAEKLADKQMQNQEKISDKQAEQSERQLQIKTTGKTPAKPKESDSGEKGRPKKSVSKLGDEGLATRDQGTNIGRGGKV